MQFCLKVVVLNRSYSTNMQPIWKRLHPTGAWESQVCSYYNFFAFLIDIINNTITYSLYNLYYVTITSANGSAVYWSRDCRAIKKWVCEVKPKAKALRHFLDFSIYLHTTRWFKTLTVQTLTFSTTRIHGLK